MKFLFILLFPFLVFCQDDIPKRFEIQDGEIEWVATFEYNEKGDVLSEIDKTHQNITVDKNNNVGKASNLVCNCFNYYDVLVSFDFTIEIIDSNFTIRARNIYLSDGDLSYRNGKIYKEILSKNLLNKKKTEFKTAGKYERFLIKLDTYLLRILTIKDARLIP
jgi:hypothetical protein